MDELWVPAASAPKTAERGARLDSWKEIAAYLNRDVRTVQRWEKTAALPVRRLQKSGLRAVYAYTDDLDGWRRDQDPAAVEAATDVAGARGDAVGIEARDATPSRRRPWWPWAAGVGVLIAIAAVAWNARARDAAAFGPFTPRPITSDIGAEFDPDISPDGKYVAYIQQAPEPATRLVVRTIDGGDARTLATGRGDLWSPAWSPDGTQLVFLRGHPTRVATIVVMSALGGVERTIAQVHPFAPRRTALIGHLLAWAPGGRFVVASDQVTPGKGSLVRIALDSGERTPITSPGEAEFDVEPTLSSDGRLLLFTRVRSEYVSDGYAQPLDAAFQSAGAARKLQSPGAWNGTPRLLERRGEVLTSSGALPRLALWRQALDGTGTPLSLGIIGDNAVQSAVDRGTGRILARTLRTRANIVRLPLAAERRAQAGPPELLAASTYMDRAAAYSPDGSQIAFVSDRSGRRQLWVAGANGEAPIEWTQTFESEGMMPAWSPDGSRIAFTGFGPSGNVQLFVADRTTRKAVPVSRDTLDYLRPAWSPDGAFLYAVATERTMNAVYRLPATGGPAEQIASGYDAVIDVAPDGKALYAVRRGPRSPELYLHPLPSGSAVLLASLNGADEAWMTPAGLYFLTRQTDDRAGPVSLAFRPHAGAIRVLEEFPRPPGRGLAISPDGRFLLTTRSELLSDLILLK